MAAKRKVEHLVHNKDVLAGLSVAALPAGKRFASALLLAHRGPRSSGV
jgi:hypothetical protein